MEGLLQPAVVQELVRPYVFWSEGRSGYLVSFQSHSLLPQRKFKSILAGKTQKVCLQVMNIFICVIKQWRKLLINGPAEKECNNQRAWRAPRAELARRLAVNILQYKKVLTLLLSILLIDKKV